MPLKRHDKNPPGNWRYEERDSAGNILKKFSNAGTLQALAKEVLAYRTANSRPRASFAEVLSDADEFQCVRLGQDDTWCQGANAKKNPLAESSSPRHILKGIVKLAQGVGNAVKGASTLLDWLGDGGKPVPQELSQTRANVCINCVHNQPGHGAAKLTGPIALAIHAQLIERKNLGVKIVGEEKLATCDICQCALLLKVHVGIEHIIAHMSNEAIKAQPDYCWIFTEAAAHDAKLSKP